MTARRLLDEIVLITDSENHISRFVSQALRDLPVQIIRVASSLRFDKNWHRFANAKLFIMDWTCRSRNPAGVIEELQAASKNPSISDKVVCILTTPVKGDIYCLAELGIHRVLRFSSSTPLLNKLHIELRKQVNQIPKPKLLEKKWKSIYFQSMAVATGKNTAIDHVEKTLNTLLADGVKSARYYDCLALINQGRQNFEAAHSSWQKAIDLNPNYFSAYENWSRSLTALNRHEEAYSLLKRMCALNNNRVSRLAQMGFLQLEMKNLVSAEHLFKTALQKNPYQPKALNGLAEVQFIKGEYEECKRLLSQSSQGPAIASRLNKLGIHLVKEGNYELALELYVNARNVLPNSDKGPLLFYNMALCYSKWGRPELARKFATLALIKDPSYQKPRNLLASLPDPNEPNTDSMTAQPVLTSSVL